MKNRLLIAALLIPAAVLAMGVVRSKGTEPRDDAGGFSANRAHAILQQLMGDGAPHPVGSAKNAEVRDRIVAILRNSGYEPEIQRAFVCGRNGTCANVENILARLDGSSNAERNAVLVAVHYDSVAAGPGASDDGGAVASLLEVARLLRTRPLRNDVIFLIDDAEEQGLLGARAFAEQHPWSKEVAAVVNAEARGTSGLDYMFETTPGNRGIIELVSHALSRPATNSINYTVYKSLPNDTDFTVFKEHPWQGVNFAIIGSPARYHTPLDNVRYSDLRSLQHRGENILAMTQAFGSRELPIPSEGDAVFFDVLGFFLVRWPESWTVAIALLVAALFIAGIILGGKARVRDLLAGAGALLLSLVATAIAAWLLHRGLAAAGAFPVQWRANAGAAIALFWLVPVVCTLLSARLLASREVSGVWAGVWGVWIAVAVVLAFVLPAVSYPLLVPAAAAAICSIAFRSERWRPLVILLPIAVAAVVILPTAWSLYDAMGASFFPVIAVVVALALSGVVPAATKADRRGVAILAALVLIAAIATMFLPAVSAETPAPAPLIVLQQDRQAPRLFVDLDAGLPARLRAAGFSDALVRPLPYDASYALREARMTAPSMSPPELEMLSNEPVADGHRMRLRLRSTRGARIVTLAFPRQRLAGVAVNGTPVQLRRGRSEFAAVRWVTTPPEGMNVDLVIRGAEPVPLHYFDVTYGLPAEARTFANARGAEYVPIGSGDRTMVMRSVTVR